jgi:hypothetical protein
LVQLFNANFLSVKGIDIAIWSCLEINIAIICASVPALKALFIKIIPKLGSLHTHAKRYGANTNGSMPLSSVDQRGAETSTNAGSDAENGMAKGRMEIKVHQSIEMKALPVSDDDSEKNLVATSWMADCYSSGNKKVPGGKDDDDVASKENRSSKGTRIPLPRRSGQDA